jgi:hypothetical protein
MAEQQTCALSGLGSDRSLPDGFVTSTAFATGLGNIMPTEPEISAVKMSVQPHNGGEHCEAPASA